MAEESVVSAVGTATEVTERALSVFSPAKSPYYLVASVAVVAA